MVCGGGWVTVQRGRKKLALVLVTSRRNVLLWLLAHHLRAALLFISAIVNYQHPSFCLMRKKVNK